MTDTFSGHRNPEEHHTTGRRAWCRCGEWCYPAIDMACSCCRAAMADENPCPHCDGTGIAAYPSLADEAAAQRLADELAPFFEPSVTDDRVSPEQRRMLDAFRAEKAAGYPSVTHTPEWHEDPAHIYDPDTNPSGCDKFYCLSRFNPEGYPSVTHDDDGS